MKSVLILFALFAVAYSDLPRCAIKVDDSFFMNGTFYGATTSAVNSSSFNFYTGTVVEGIYYVEDNPKLGKLMTNTSFVISDGSTGKFIEAGWSWELVTGSGVYTQGKTNDVAIPCKFNSVVVPIPQNSKLVGQLFELYPFSQSMPHHPGTICQGLNPDTNSIQTMAFDGNNHLLVTNSVSKISNINLFVSEMRPLVDHDASKFIPCKPAEFTDKKPSLHLSLYERMKVLLPEL